MYIICIYIYTHTALWFLVRILYCAMKFQGWECILITWFSYESKTNPFNLADQQKLSMTSRSFGHGSFFCDTLYCGICGQQSFGPNYWGLPEFGTTDFGRHPYFRMVIPPSIGIKYVYPLVNVYITMETHHCQWVNPLQMAMFNGYFELPKGIQ